jgi:hypothetical protein
MYIIVVRKLMFNLRQAFHKLKLVDLAKTQNVNLSAWRIVYLRLAVLSANVISRRKILRSRKYKMKGGRNIFATK